MTDSIPGHRPLPADVRILLAAISTSRLPPGTVITSRLLDELRAEAQEDQ